MVARLSDEGRNQFQARPNVGERFGHLDQRSPIKHNLEDDGDHDIQIRGLSWTGIHGLSVAQDAKEVLEYRSVLESVQLYETDVSTAKFGAKFDPGIVTSADVAQTAGRRNFVGQ